MSNARGMPGGRGACRSFDLTDTLGGNNEEQESKTARKMAQVKERGGGGEERKETLADKPLDFENRPLGLSCLTVHAPTFDAVISCSFLPFPLFHFLVLV